MDQGKEHYYKEALRKASATIKHLIEKVEDLEAKERVQEAASAPAREEKYEQVLQKAAGKIRELLAENEALKKKAPVAVVGMACHFPGGADNPERFWTLLRNGVDAIKAVPAERWPAAAYYAADQEAPGKMYTVRGGFLDTPVDYFDASFFGIAPKEARALDPQHRLLLEISWEALEHACLDPSTLKNSKTGVFVGMSGDDYAQTHRHSGYPERIDAYSIMGTTFSTAVGRISYTFGLQGPCIALDTACSSSLVALHLACQSLRSGESDLALAGGVNLILSPASHICFSKLRAISPEGKCKTFDASADGYVRGEGGGIVVLKLLQDALRDGDRILAVIRGSAVNQDRRTNGLAAPNGKAQQAVIRQALADAGLRPEQVDYVEAHGTGTVLGDPIEVEALGAVLGVNRQEPLRLGAVKTNIGHLEQHAAGVAGFIKVVLSLMYEAIPPNLHFHCPNPHIPWDTLPIRIPTEQLPWKRSTRPRIAGVSAFGFSDTNAHVILEEAPPALVARAESPVVRTASAPERPLHILTLSARSAEALAAQAARYAAYLSDHPEIPLADVCYTANTSRSRFEHRLVVAAADKAEMQAKLASYHTGQPERLVASAVPRDREPPRIAFLCTGQGAQYPGMGAILYQTQPIFCQALDHCAHILDPWLGRSLLDLLFTEESSDLHETAFTQPALFALEYALAQMWLSWGIHPEAVLGHSVGEYVAACIAGVFSLEDGLKMIAARGRLMQALVSLLYERKAGVVYSNWA